ncbi:EF-P lysine aminoacylase EpmA [Spiribacter vilamensis]|uniref:Lysyl-tRNA synthetase class 2 n=1 Tax=Spiribacter vilamensis TaxID=531306 RepID=A0A4Q8CYC6_9GAMM|nr:EF-P lysine aminoacylase EpmA [Spiribacter vilamensis]RZU97973.1 lysyl-tRNA synthetase class 2 [Spiribacter vilamensis]TVO61113.1 EF-P lysine aminoacylase GenX [Spiribacter vilamensis]
MESDSEWAPAASLAVLRQRAEWLAGLRRFFHERGVIEVETPVLAAAGVTDPQVECLQESTTERWLQPSPEYAMKRLLAAGIGDCYQITPAFRAGEQGRWHNPEFTLLEWYRVGFSADAMMDEVEQLTACVLGAGQTARLTYQSSFIAAGLPDPLTASEARLAAAAAANPSARPVPAGLSRRDLLDWLFSQVVTSHLPERCFITHYPADQAVLARLDPTDPSVAERFELFVQGVEIANGFRELTDAVAQRDRFEADQAARRAAGQAVMAMDERLLAAMTAGLPDCAGVAMGLDRLFAIAAGVESLAGVLAFPWLRA